MQSISALERTLKQALGWHKPQVQCLIQIMPDLIAVRSANLKELACAIEGIVPASIRFIGGCSDFSRKLIVRIAHATMRKRPVSRSQLACAVRTMRQNHPMAIRGTELSRKICLPRGKMINREKRNLSKQGLGTHFACPLGTGN